MIARLELKSAVDSAFKNGLMALFMKAIGRTTKLREKEHSGMLKATSILETSKPTKLMATESTLIKMAPGTKASGSMMFSKVKARRRGTTALGMWDTTRTE